MLEDKLFFENKRKRKAVSVLIIALLLTEILSIGLHIEPANASSDAPLADAINYNLNRVKDWQEITDVGAVMHKSLLRDFDKFITSRADASDWKGVLEVKRHAEQAGYSSVIINEKVKLALTNMPMFKGYALPITDRRFFGYFWPWDRYVLYGYRYARELNWETEKWNATSGFLGLKAARDFYGRAFYRANPDIPFAEDMAFGTRWHQAGSLMDSFFIFYTLGEKNAFPYAVQEWKWMNDNLWQTDHYDYSTGWKGWEFSSISVFPPFAKLNTYGTKLRNWDRAATDIQNRYVGNLWNSPQWHNLTVTVHHFPNNPEQRIDGTLDGWLILDTFYDSFNSTNRMNMRRMLEGNGTTQAWSGFLKSDVVERIDTHPNDGATAETALTLFLLGISPQSGRGLAIPLVSERHSDYTALNYRHFEFDYSNHLIKIPVWGNSTLRFLYGKTPVNLDFQETGIYAITFAEDWSSIVKAVKISDLYPDEYYLWNQKISPAPAIRIFSPTNTTYASPGILFEFSINRTASWIGYSLDKKSITIIHQDETPAWLWLPDGSHALTVYIGNTDSKEVTIKEINFSIDTKENCLSPYGDNCDNSGKIMKNDQYKIHLAQKANMGT